MKIGIIGAGQIGGTLTRRLRELGHEVNVSNSRSPETLADLANETGATAVWAKDAAADADLVIVSIPQKNVPDLADGIVDARKPGAPVIETNNYYPQQRDGEIAAIEDGQLESAWVAEQIGAPVYKVFNGIWWKHLLESGKPSGTADRIALPIAGEDGPGRELVHAVVDQLGFDPSTPARSPSRGVSSPERRCTARTSTPTTPARRSPRRRPSARRMERAHRLRCVGWPIEHGPGPSRSLCGRPTRRSCRG